MLDGSVCVFIIGVWESAASEGGNAVKIPHKRLGFIYNIYTILIVATGSHL